MPIDPSREGIGLGDCRGRTRLACHPADWSKKKISERTPVWDALVLFPVVSLALCVAVSGNVALRAPEKLLTRVRHNQATLTSVDRVERGRGGHRHDGTKRGLGSQAHRSLTYRMRLPRIGDVGERRIKVAQRGLFHIGG